MPHRESDEGKSSGNYCSRDLKNAVDELRYVESTKGS